MRIRMKREKRSFEKCRSDVLRAQGLMNANDLATYGLTESFAESYALSGSLMEYRASLSRAVQRGLLG